jgi:hypothetical protein
VGATTLRDWRNADSLGYHKLQQNVLPEVRERAAEMHTDLAEREVELSGRLVSDLGERMDKEKMPVRDLPGAIRNLDVGAGVNRTKAGELRNEPNVRVQKQQDVGDILRALEAEGFPLPEHMKAAIDVEVIEEEPEREAT